MRVSREQISHIAPADDQLRAREGPSALMAGAVQLGPRPIDSCCFFCRANTSPHDVLQNFRAMSYAFSQQTHTHTTHTRTRVWQKLKDPENHGFCRLGVSLLLFLSQLGSNAAANIYLQSLPSPLTFHLTGSLPLPPTNMAPDRGPVPTGN